MSSPYFRTDNSNVEEDFYMRTNYNKKLLYNKCDTDSYSKNPYFCSRKEISEDPMNCSEDYTMRMNCLTSYNTHTNCGKRVAER